MYKNVEIKDLVWIKCEQLTFILVYFSSDKHLLLCEYLSKIMTNNNNWQWYKKHTLKYLVVGTTTIFTMTNLNNHGGVVNVALHLEWHFEHAQSIEGSLTVGHTDFRNQDTWVNSRL